MGPCGRGLADNLQDVTLVGNDTGGALATLILITHNLEITHERADRIIVLLRGKVVEHGVPSEIVKRPQHPYTQALVSAAARLATPRRSLDVRTRSRQVPTTGSPCREDGPLIEVKELTKTFHAPGASSRKDYTQSSYSTAPLQRAHPDRPR